VIPLHTPAAAEACLAETRALAEAGALRIERERVE